MVRDADAIVGRPARDPNEARQAALRNYRDAIELVKGVKAEAPALFFPGSEMVKLAEELLSQALVLSRAATGGPPGTGL